MTWSETTPCVERCALSVVSWATMHSLSPTVAVPMRVDLVRGWGRGRGAVRVYGVGVGVRFRGRVLG